MKKISANELQNLKNSFEFKVGTINSHFERSQNKMIYYTPIDHLIFTCTECKTPHYFEATMERCPSCRISKNFTFDKSDTDEYGIFCRRCRQGFTSWICEYCGTSNPVEGTFHQLSKKGKGCFIATAVYGSPNAIEVEILKAFRDNWLTKYLIGRLFIKLYYIISPPVANLISKHTFLKAIIKSILVMPLIKLANNIKERRTNHVNN